MIGWDGINVKVVEVAKVVDVVEAFYFPASTTLTTSITLIT
jgi:hypothetical protein